MSISISGLNRSAASAQRRIIYTTLTNMAKGEIYDGVQGGFFRYATKPDWSAPHYEKLLEINAGLIQNYAAAYMVFGKSEYRRTMEGTIAWLRKNLRDTKTGAFYGSQDADEEYYKSSKRAGLKPPHVDRTIYAGSNAQTVSALVAAYGATGGREYLNMAQKAADFIIRSMYSSRCGVFHYYADGDGHLDGRLADNALFGLALLDLYNATGKPGYLKTAEEISRLLVDAFYDKQDGRFRPSIAATAVKPSTAGALMDYNTTVANYRALVFLARVYRMNGNNAVKRTVDNTIAGFGSTWDKFKPAAGILGTALEWNLGNPVDITIVTDGSPDDFLYQAGKVYVP